jgi:hypothetical protein
MNFQNNLVVFTLVVPELALGRVDSLGRVGLRLVMAKNMDEARAQMTSSPLCVPEEEPGLPTDLREYQKEQDIIRSFSKVINSF